MKITITLEVNDLTDVDKITNILKAGLGSAAIVETVTSEDAPPAKPDAAATKRSEGAKKSAATRAANKAKKKAAADAGTTGGGSATSQSSTTTEKTAKAPKVTEGALLKAVKGAIARTSTDEVRTAFASFNSKDGSPCAKLSDVKEKDYAELVGVLEDMVGVE